MQDKNYLIMSINCHIILTVDLVVSKDSKVFSLHWARPQILESLETTRSTVKIISQLMNMIKYSCPAFLVIFLSCISSKQQLLNIVVCRIDSWDIMASVAARSSTWVLVLIQNYLYNLHYFCPAFLVM